MRVLLVVVLLFAVMSCSSYNQLNNCEDSFVRPNWEQIKVELAKNRQLWESKNILSYSYTYETISWVQIPPLNVRVEGGTVVSATYPDGSLIETSQLQVWSIKQRFDNIARVAQNPKPCEGIGVEYDVQLGFPKGYGWGIAEKGLADAMGGYRISNFTVLP